MDKKACFDLPDNLDCFKGNVFLQCFGCCGNGSGDNGSGTTGDFTIIYPNGGTKENPSDITIDSRYVEDNPFAGYHVSCELQVLYEGKWGKPGMYTNAEKGVYYCAGGEAAQLLPDDKIVVQTGKHADNVLLSISFAMFNPFGLNSTPNSVSFPARVLVTKLGKIED